MMSILDYLRQCLRICEDSFAESLAKDLGKPMAENVLAAMPEPKGCITIYHTHASGVTGQEEERWLGGEDE